MKGLLGNRNIVLINESHMDSINLKYLSFKVLNAEIESLKLQIGLKENENLTLSTKLEKEKKDNRRLQMLNQIDATQRENDKQIYENKILYYKEKAKGKFTSFLMGSAVGGLIVSIIIILSP